jgi:hypothetical protein
VGEGVGVWVGLGVWDGVGGGAVKVGGTGVSLASVGELSAEHPAMKMNVSVNRIMVEDCMARISETGDFTPQF